MVIKPSNFNHGHSNNCKNRNICIYTNLCNNNCNKECRFCNRCNIICSDFIPNTCEELDKPPYVCNGCDSRKGCRKIKKIYKAKEAHEKYKDLLINSRVGANLTDEELNVLSKILYQLLKMDTPQL